MEIPNLLQLVPDIKLDWKTYYQQFCMIHGEPVMHEGLQLFPDGYRYSATDYAGPEIPPPTDEKELLFLFRAYWGIRYSMVKAEWSKVNELWSNLRNMQSVRSVQLHHRFFFKEETSGKRKSKTSQINLQMFEDRAKWLKADMEACQAKLEEYADAEQWTQRTPA